MRGGYAGRRKCPRRKRDENVIDRRERAQNHGARNLPRDGIAMDIRTLFRAPATRRGLLIATQLALVALAYLLAFLLRGDFRLSVGEFDRLVDTLPYLLAVRLFLSHQFKLDRGYWEHVGLRDLFDLTAATTFGSFLYPVLLLVFGELYALPAAVFLLDWLLTIVLLAAVRVVARAVRERRNRTAAARGLRTFVIGAGEAGEQLLRQVQHDRLQAFQVVGLIDDDPAKRDRALHGVPVLGSADELRGLASRFHVKQALIAIPSATVEQLRRLVDRCVEAEVEVKLLPPMKNLVRPDVEVSRVRDVSIEDLLGRDPVQLDLSAVEPDLAGKVVLVTGAGGSIGSELARQIARYHPLQLILVERAESPLYFTHLEVARANPEVQVVPVLASVTNPDRMETVFETYRPTCVFHAAAYKHVPMLEWNVIEGVWNNIIGTLRVARAAARVGAQKFVLISTDKAVNPSSVLGATKLVAERLVLELPSLRASSTDFRVVRFGNVLGSDGSVVPLFKRQIDAGGPVTVTHPEVRRYFMTIPEAVQLLLLAAALPEAAGRISLLEMGTQVRVLDLAEQMIRLAGLRPHQDVEIVYTGLRPGEKLEEELLASDEAAVPTSVDKIRTVERNGTQGALLAKRLRNLVRIAVRRDEGTLLRVLATLAPEYHPPVTEPRFANGNGAVPRVAAAGRNGRGPVPLAASGVLALRQGTNGRV
jgi:FlaA1/EpsC-like NDP-sugar epimerase